MLLSSSMARAQGRASSQKEAAALKAAFRPAAPLVSKACAAKRSRACRAAAPTVVAAAAVTADTVRPTSAAAKDKSLQKPTVITTGEASPDI
mgnify:FL=1